jgi:toxin-antitoxin system PIN domain toxin
LILVDANVVVSAMRADHVHHLAAREWLQGVVDDSVAFSIPDVVGVSVVRLLTHRKVFADPESSADVFAALSILTADPAHVRLSVNDRVWREFDDLCSRFDVSGDLVPDAFLAALAIAYGGAVASFDRDFRRFEGLALVRPGA